MKKFIYSLFLLITLFTVSNLTAQNLDLKWSEKMNYDNKKDGFFHSFVSSTDQYVYGLYYDFTHYDTRLFQPYNYSPLYEGKIRRKSIKLVAFDRETMNQVASVSLKSKKDKARYQKLQGFKYIKTIIKNGIIYVFWEKQTDKRTDIFAEAFGLQLERIEKPKKVYSGKIPVAGKGFLYSQKAFGIQSMSAVVILGGKNGTDNLLIGSEVSKGKGENKEFSYTVIDPELNQINKGTVILPILQAGWFSGSNSEYEYGNNGNLYIRSTVRLTLKERRKMGKGAGAAFSMLNILNVNSNELTTYNIKYDGINIFNFNLIVDDNNVRIYGFFNDMQKDPSGTRTNGIFYTTIDSTGALADPNFSYFDKETLTKLFKDDWEEEKRKAAKNLSEDALDEAYVIETARIMDKDHIILFCSKMYNYMVTNANNMSGGTSPVRTTTEYYCRKSNVTAFKLNNTGDIVWASNIDRQVTYSGWNIFDLKVMSDKNNFYVAYGSFFGLNATGKKRVSRKRKEIRDEFEYAVFDYETGEAKKNEFIVNQKEVARKERKSINPMGIQVIDNQFFVNSKRVTMKPGKTILLSVLTPIFPPALAILLMNGNIRKGQGNVGVFEAGK